MTRSSSSKSNSDFTEYQWVAQVEKILQKEAPADDTAFPICIFNVPTTLLASDPASYIPQQVAIGPYHYLRAELYEMDRKKETAAQRTKKQLGEKFEDLRMQMESSEMLHIRSSYHKYLGLEDKTLSWMMLIDASFLLEILQNYSKRKSGHVMNAIFRDMFMLENQIPFFVLTKVLEFQLKKRKESELVPEISTSEAREALIRMLGRFCQELSPFKGKKDQDQDQLPDGCYHLLDFLYQMIVPKSVSEEPEIVDSAADQAKGTSHKKRTWNKFKRAVTICLNKVSVWKVLPNISNAPQPLKGILRVAQSIYTCFSQSGLGNCPQTDEENPNSSTLPQVIQKIPIPSVSNLSDAGVGFKPTDGSIETIVFDRKTGTLHLPAITLDVNTKAVLRNLVAYEASKASGRSVVTRYTELMNGIIDTEEDAKLLIDKRIITSHLKSDEKVCELWNGMSKSIKLTKVHELDTAIDGVNSYYNSRWKVKTKKLWKVSAYGIWRFLVFLATVVILGLLGLQTICSFHNCKQIE